MLHRHHHHYRRQKGWGAVASGLVSYTILRFPLRLPPPTYQSFGWCRSFLYWFGRFRNVVPHTRSFIRPSPIFLHWLFLCLRRGVPKWRRFVWYFFFDFGFGFRFGLGFGLGLDLITGSSSSPSGISSSPSGMSSSSS